LGLSYFRFDNRPNRAGEGSLRVTKSVFSERYDQFRHLLIEARKAAGFTQAGLAQRLKRPQSYVSKYERGERRLDVVEFLDVAEAIGVDSLAFLRKLQDSQSGDLPGEAD
jgi:ribosome-binding protein aMBF1 (putative translation factor)